MTMERILAEIRGLEGVLELAPRAGSGHPELSWGDHFFYYAPDGEVPHNRQPHATIVTKDYPGDTASRLAAPDRWRLNIHVGARLFTDLVGRPPGAAEEPAVDFGAVDVFLPHPLYGTYGWVAVVNPGPATTARALEALREAHRADRSRVARREGLGGAAPAQDG